jgi:hypothetical protein
MSEESEEFDIQLKEEYLEHKEKYALSMIDGEKQ